MSKTRYGHSNVGGGDQDQAERKDENWQRRQGGRESRDPGSRGEPTPKQDGDRGRPPQGTNTQGELAGIGEASEQSDARVGGREDEAPESSASVRDRDLRGAGTDQPRRMGGPLGPDPDDPRLPEGLQNADNRGTGAGGFDPGVDASRVGAVHQGAREEDAS